MLLARWRSSVVYRYAQEAPLTTLTARFTAKCCPTASAPISPPPPNWLSYEKELAAVKAELKRLASSSESNRSPKCVLNTPSGVVHALVTDITVSDSMVWRTACGWRFSHTCFRFLEERFAFKPCAKCFDTGPLSDTSGSESAVGG
eukprot:2489710-Amphidinium_carterae.1